MDQLRYNDEKARLSYVYANYTALQRFRDALVFVIAGSYSEAVEKAVEAASAFLAAGPGGSWDPLAYAVAYAALAYELHVSADPGERKGPGLPFLASCPNALKSYGDLCVRGERKYSRGNYRLGAPVTQYLDSGLRHCNAVLRGEHDDPEMNVPHETPAFWNFWNALDQPTWRDDRLPTVQQRHVIADAYASPARVPEGVVYALN